MTVFLGILAFVVILAILILVHELGHFTSAKLMGVRVDEFGLGFPPRLKGWRRGDTIYSLNAIPLGGFVKMQGENGEDIEPDSFGAKAPWQRLIILLAGPSMNLILALSIFFFAFILGSPRGLTQITAVEKQSPAARAGLRSGDQILAVDGRNVQYRDQLQSAVDGYLDKQISLRVRRAGKEFVVSLVPRKHHSPNQGAIGVLLGKSTTIRYGPAQSLKMSIDAVGSMVGSVPLLLQSIGQQHGSNVAGPIGIAQATTGVVQDEPSQGFGSVLEFVALLSANLGVLNLLPIPALDGGRIVFVLISWVRRRNLDPQLEGMVHMLGMAVLLLLILVVSYQDIVRWVSGGAF